MNKPKKKIERCKHSLPNLTSNKLDYICTADGLEDEQIHDVTEDICESCERFKSRFIEYPLTIKGIENKKINTQGIGHECGALCEVRPCGEEYQGKHILVFTLETYLSESYLLITKKQVF